LPEIYRTAVTPELAGRVVDLLLDGRTPPPSEAELSDCLSRHAGNLREALFELYDVCETSGQWPVSSGQKKTPSADH
jgi:hypothetical protein